MILSSPSATTSTHKAYDSVWVEFDSIWLKPRLVFDERTRDAFDACAEICNTVMCESMGTAPSAQCPLVRCALRTDGPGSYLLSFEIPEEGPALPEPDTTSPARGRWKARKRTQEARTASQPDPDLQLRLLSATRILVEMLLAVDTVCSTPAGQLSVTVRRRNHGHFVEFVNGVRVLRHIHRDSWMMLSQPRIQKLLSRAFAPFQDAELHTMSVREIPQEGSLGASWVVTANRRLQAFANGALLEMPALQGTMLGAQQISAERS